MKRNCIAALLGGMVLLASGARGEDAEVTRCFVTVLKQVEVAAREPGIIEQLDIKEGVLLKTGQEVGHLKLLRAKLEREQAAFELAAARKESENDVNVRYAHAATDVAVAELEEKIAANKRVKGSVSAAELRRLELEVSRARLQIEQAEHEQEVAKMTTKIREARLNLAEANLARLKIHTPVEGVVVELFRQEGEWVNPGDPICRIVQVHRLRVQGWLPASKYGPEVADRTVTVFVPLPGGKIKEVPGKVTFVSPEVDTATNEFEVWAEVENPKLVLRPGTRASMKIHLDEGSSAKASKE